jgi:3-dehydroquinate synthase
MASSTTGVEPAEIQLRFGERGPERVCRVVVGPARLSDHWQPGWSSAAVIGDANVVALHGEAVARALRELVPRVTVLSFPAGEPHKTRATKERLEDELIAAGFDRQCCVVALGGGISLDVAGFVAATFMRGVSHVNVPTSLLAMVDAAIGGKTGVNTERGKNLIGAIHQPRAVLIDPQFLDTLPAEEWPCGLAEMAKHAVIADEPLFAWLEANAELVARAPWRGGAYPLRRCVELKGEIVEQDEREAGRRAVLNFGHTVGHALEKTTELDHGRAVATGMLVEGRVALSRCGFPPADLSRLRSCLGQLGLPTRPPELDFDALLPYMAVDKKKRRDDRLQLAIPERIGVMASEEGRHTLATDPELVRQAWLEESRR